MYELLNILYRTNVTPFVGVVLQEEYTTSRTPEEAIAI